MVATRYIDACVWLVHRLTIWKMGKLQKVHFKWNHKNKWGFETPLGIRVFAVGRHSFVAGNEGPTGHTYGIVSTGPYIKILKSICPQVFRSQTNGFGFASRSWKVTQVVLTFTHPKKNWVMSFETEYDESICVHWNIQCVCSSKISQMMIIGKTVMSQAQSYDMDAKKIPWLASSISLYKRLGVA
jgi:hypothetical protein